ncbi:MAG: LbtU family siderophore porin [bacterium]|nr:LbtU family siderophore porin [bacterium]
MIEIEAGWHRDYEQHSSSDIILATTELEIHAEPSEFATGHVLFLYEEDTTEPMALDEAVLDLHYGEDLQIALTGGKFYLPFGNYDSNMISDPLTLELGEINQSALMLQLAEKTGLHASMYAFNCDLSEGQNDNIDCFGGDIGYNYENNDLLAGLGLGLISNLPDSDGLETLLEDEGAILQEHGSGIAAHLKIEYTPVYVMFEYVGALKDFDLNREDIESPDEADIHLGTLPVGRERIKKIWSSNIEAGFNFTILDKPSIFAVAIQHSKNLPEFLPKTRYLSTLATELEEGLTAGLEYSFDKDFSEDEHGSGENAHTITGQLALAF